MRLISSLTALCAAALFTSQAIAAPLILATKSFTEQHILSAMTVQYLQRKGSRCSRKQILRLLSPVTR